jgi:hypothetical protein
MVEGKLHTAPCDCPMIVGQLRLGRKRKEPRKRTERNGFLRIGIENKKERH